MNKPIDIGIIDNSQKIDIKVLENSMEGRNIKFYKVQEIPDDAVDIKNRLQTFHVLIIINTVPTINDDIFNKLERLSLIICTDDLIPSINLELCRDLFINVKKVKNKEKDSLFLISSYLKEWIDSQLNTDIVIENYQQDPKVIFEILEKKHVNNLYHANTFATAQTFIEQDAILSRGFVESNHLLQTVQDSDDIDKKFGIWDDVFLDGVDLHKEYRRANFYGPILFVLDLKIFLELESYPLLITRFNPQYWDGIPTWKRKYLFKPEEFERDYLTYEKISHRMMFTIRSCGTHIKLSKYLKEIIIDECDVKKGGVNLSSILDKELRIILDQNKLSHIPISYRSHNYPFCACIGDYRLLCKKNPNELKKRFLRQ